MALLASVLTAAVALLHVGFLALEMFLWTTPWACKALRRTAAQQAETAVMAKNQGLYNGFLAAGLAWSLVAPPALALPLRLFFLGCVAVAGLYGAATASRNILFLQAAPALLALAVTLL
jgi:putative membrane protein